MVRLSTIYRRQPITRTTYGTADSRRREPREAAD
jgi:hypothetical protein